MARSQELPRLELRDRNCDDPTLSAAGVAAHWSTLPAAQVSEDRYVIITELARGGLGRVFRAHDLRLDRTVAIKELISPTPGLRERFMRETAITARLQHPAIVPLYDAGTRKEGPFYVMKLLGSGQTLKERAEASAFDDRLALLPHVIAVADAIAYAHSLNIIHRDLKPSNVLVGPFGETVVIDWGLAKDLSGSPVFEEQDGGPFREAPPDFTSDGTVIGTPQYLSPEQARGEAAGKPADIYALGALMYHVLSGRAPYDGDRSADVVERIKKQPPPELARRQPGIPRDLVAIVETAMARSVSARYRSAQEFVDDLKRFQTGQLVLAHQYSARTLALRWLRRYQLPVAVAVVAAVVLAAIGITSFRRVQRERAAAIRERAIAVAGRNALILQQAEAALDHDPTLAVEWLKVYPADGASWGRVQTIAADAYSRGIARHILSGRPVHATALSPDGKYLFTGGPEQPVRQWDLQSGSLIRSELFGSFINDIQASPDGNHVALCDRNGEVVLWTPKTNEKRVLGKHHGMAYGIAFSPDGQLLASGTIDRVQIWNLVTGEQRSLNGPWGTVILTFSPKGQLLATAGQDGTLRLWDLIRGGRLDLTGHTGTINDIAFSPDGAGIASVGDDHSVRLWDVSNGSGRVLGMHDGSADIVRFSPTGELIATGGWDKKVRVWNLQTGKQRVLSGHTDRLSDLVFSPLGGELASSARDAQVRVWDLPTGESRILQGHTGDVRSLRFSPDGRVLISAGDDPTRVWELPRGAMHVIGRHHGPTFHAVPSRDGRLAASDGADGVVRLWDFETGTERSFVGHRDSVNGLEFSPDGGLLASAGWDNTARIWNVNTGQARVLAGNQLRIRTVSFSHDGSTLATAGSDGTIGLWNPETGASTGTLTGHIGGVNAAVFAPVESLLASAGEDGTVRIWDVNAKTGRTLGKHDKAAFALAFNPDGKLLASGAGDATVRLWDLTTGAVRIFRGHDAQISRLAFSPRGDLLISTSWDNTIRIWNIATGESQALRGAKAPVRTLAVAPDGHSFAAGSDDHKVHIWDLDHLTYAMIRGSDGPVRGVAYFRRGPTLLTAGEDGSVRQWALDFSSAVPNRPSDLAAWLNARTTAAISPRSTEQDE